MHRKPEIVFRAMKEDSDGKPLVERSARALGVRIKGRHSDIHIDSQGQVHPKTGGMSVTPDDYRRLPNHRLPESLGGRGRDPIFSFQIANLPSTLALSRDKPSHALVEPLKSCLFEEYEQNLHGTREDWVKCHE